MMFVATTALLAALSSVAQAAPASSVDKRAAPGQANIDTVIINYALTLEHLEATFYNNYLPSKQAFTDAGYGGFVHDRFVEIGGEEAQHVQFLTAVNGAKAVKQCTYDFMLDGTPSAFVSLAGVLEGVGISAYLGAAANITEPAYLTAAASILTVEGRHSAWIQGVPENSDSFPQVFDTPLDFDQVYSLAAPFIVKCPSSNAALPVKAFPAATFSPTPTSLGQTIKVSSSKYCEGDVMGFVSGLMTTVVPINNGEVTLPDIVTYGRSYAVILKKNSKSITDANTKAGPIIIQIQPSAAVGAAYQQNAAGN